MVAQLDILETMTPLEFLSFRDRLESGSGFQSHQFRELEFALGRKDPKALERYPGGHRGAARGWSGGWQSASLWDAFLQSPRRQRRRRCPGPTSSATSTRRVEPSPALQEVLVEVYRSRPGPGRALRAAGGSRRRHHGVALPPREDGAADDRHPARHRRQRGGGYLMTTLNQPLFPDLWAIRTEL